MKKPRIAIIHDWLTGMRGGEKCLEVFCELFPEATLFTLLREKGSASPTIEGMDIRTSFLQGIPGITQKYRNFLPLFPAAIESFDLSKYDLILSSSHCVAKGVKVPAGALHISYCHTPARYLWQFFDEYFASENPLKRRVIKYFIESLKKWDLRSNKRVDHFVANSKNVRNRIKEFYSRDADVIYPPVDVTPKTLPLLSERLQEIEHTAHGPYYLVVSALVPYKRIDIAIEAFNKSGKRLIVIGTGPELEKLRKEASVNIAFLGWVSDEELVDHYSGCQALVFPGEEDFGIVPLEAQAYGKPVIAYGKGGALETVVPIGSAGAEPTGVFFFEKTAEALNGAIDVFEKSRGAFNANGIRSNALKFNRERFKQEVMDYIELRWKEHACKK